MIIYEIELPLIIEYSLIVILFKIDSKLIIFIF